MTSLLLFTVLAAAPAPPPVAARDEAVVERCHVRLTSRYGQLDSFAVASVARRGRTILVRGSATRLERPTPAPAGMMTPTHVLATPSAFRCDFRGGKLRRASLAPR